MVKVGRVIKIVTIGSFQEKIVIRIEPPKIESFVSVIMSI